MMEWANSLPICQKMFIFSEYGQSETLAIVLEIQVQLTLVFK